jgi:peptide/nickel transport system substrate-binding protein
MTLEFAQERQDVRPDRTLADGVRRRGLLATAIAAQLGRPGRAQAAVPDDTLVVASRMDDLSTLDPAEAFEVSAWPIIRSVYDTLVTFHPEGSVAAAERAEIVAGLAERWQVSPDGMTFTFFIRDDAKFHSGRPVTAEDCAFSLQRTVLLNKTPSFKLKTLGLTAANVRERVTAVGPRELRLVIDKPLAPSFVLNLLTNTTASIVERASAIGNAQQDDLGNRWLKTNSAGSGGYVLRSVRAAESSALDRADGYWRAQAPLRRVVTRHVPEPATQRLLLGREDIDVAANLQSNDAEAVAAAGGPATILAEDSTYIWFLSLNTAHPALAQPKVRLALKYLVDYEGIAATVLKGRVRVHQSVIPKPLLGYIEDRPFRHDPDRARTLLAEAGFAGGFTVRINIRSVSERIEIAQVLQAAWAQVGIRAEIDQATGAQNFTTFRSRQHEVFLGTWVPDYPDPHVNVGVFYGNADNRADANLVGSYAWRNGWRDAAIDARVNEALLLRDLDQRRQAYEALERDAQQVAPYVFMFQQIDVTGLRRSVRGYTSGGGLVPTFYWNVRK